jgi:hypothetical protein
MDEHESKAMKEKVGMREDLLHTTYTTAACIPSYIRELHND